VVVVGSVAAGAPGWREAGSRVAKVQYCSKLGQQVSGEGAKGPLPVRPSPLRSRECWRQTRRQPSGCYCRCRCRHRTEPGVPGRLPSRRQQQRPRPFSSCEWECFAKPPVASSNRALFYEHQPDVAKMAHALTGDRGGAVGRYWLNGLYVKEQDRHKAEHPSPVPSREILCQHRDDETLPGREILRAAWQKPLLAIYALTSRFDNAMIAP
jgi:hypothetical protein